MEMDNQWTKMDKMNKSQPTPRKTRRLPLAASPFSGSARPALLTRHGPRWQAFVEVQDAETRALRCRVFQSGRCTMLYNAGVKGRHVRRTLGEFQAGPGGKTIDEFRRAARAEAGKIDDDPQEWLEGAAAKDATEITIEGAFDLALKASIGRQGESDWKDPKIGFSRG